MTANRTRNVPPEEAPDRYRIVVDGALSTAHLAWFEEAQVSVSTGQTEIDVAVPDQTALHGILRRIHDLHMKLLSVERIPFETSDQK